MKVDPILAMQVRALLNRPIPKSISQIENRINNLIVDDVIEIHVVDSSDFKLFSIALCRDDLMTKRGTMRANVAKLIRPVLSRAERIDVIGFPGPAAIVSKDKP